MLNSKNLGQKPKRLPRTVVHLLAVADPLVGKIRVCNVCELVYQMTIGGRSFVYRDIDRDKSTVTEVTRRIRRYRERLPRKKLQVECEDYTQPLYDRTSLPPGMTLLNTWHYPVYYSALRLMTVHPHILHGASFVALFLCDVLSSFPPCSHLLHVRGVNGGYGSQS